LPVIVWIHGGTQITTTGSEYDGSWLVTRGTPVIAVTINYRLNIFAFFAHAELTAENPAIGSGNYAALDQQFALQWVTRNIASFGGDPDNVTIAGNSGGGQAVCILLVSPPAAGLFQRAITESAPCQDQYYPTLTASEEAGAKIAAELGCSDVACLRKLPVAAILAKQTGIAPAGQPATGGGAFPLPIRHAIAFGQFNKVPVMEGSARDEALFFVAPAYDGAGKKVTEAEYPQIIAAIFGETRAPAIVEQYPTADYPTPSYALVAVETDSGENGEMTRNRLGACNTELANRLLAPWVPVYAYEFADENAPWPIPLFPLSTGGMKGAGHTSELPYLWKMDVALTDAQQRLSTTMIKYWTNFAAHGDPNGEGLPAWPKFSSSSPQSMTFRTDRVAAESTFRDVHKCKFWFEQGWTNLYGPYDAPFPTH
jgi:para-nitrobenzyl esterase